jgi:hypothetical protein
MEIKVLVPTPRIGNTKLIKKLLLSALNAFNSAVFIQCIQFCCPHSSLTSASPKWTCGDYASQSASQFMSRPPNKWKAAAQAAERGESRWKDDDRYNDSEFLEQETRKVQGDSVNSTRRALQKLNETQYTAQNSLAMLNNQSGFSS